MIKYFMESKSNGKRNDASLEAKSPFSLPARGAACICVHPPNRVSSQCSSQWRERDV